MERRIIGGGTGCRGGPTWNGVDVLDSMAIGGVGGCVVLVR